MTLTFDSSIRRVTILWTLTLTAVVVLALSSDILIERRVTNSETFAEYVDIAARQQTLTVQIALYATQYITAAEAAERDTAARQLRMAIDVMQVEQEQLIAEIVDEPDVLSIFDSGERAIRHLSSEYWMESEALLSLSLLDASLAAMIYSRITTQAETLRERTGDGVQALLMMNSMKKRALLGMSDAIVTVVFGLVAAQFVFVFRPTITRLRQRGRMLETEIAERKKVEIDLRASEERFRLLVETAPVGIFQTDNAGATTWVNAGWREIMGMHGQDVTRSSWIDAIHPEDRADALAEGKRRREAGLPISMDYRIIRPDGSIAAVHINAVPLMDGMGDRSGVLGTLIDLTERQLAQEQALKLEAEKQRIKVLGEFIRDTSHDLRTPLTVIKSGLGLCRRINDLERIREKVSVMDAHVGYLNIVIDQLQEMAVLDTLTDITLMTMNIAPLLRDVCNQAARQADTEGKSFGIDMETALPDVYVSPERFLSVLHILIDNATRYTSPGGHIVVSAKQEEKSVVITVKDNGIGISEEQVPHVFERFFKADKARGVGGGAGLGLPIAKRIVELHGGNISLASMFNQGTTVAVSLRAV